MKVTTLLHFIIGLLFCIPSGSLGAQDGPSQNAEEDQGQEVEVSPRCAAVLLVGGGFIVGTASALLTGPLLAAFGFTGEGVAASSAAAKWQSTIGSVQSGSLFSSLQSVAMAGAGPKVIAVGTWTGAALGAGFLRETCTVIDGAEPNSKAAALADDAVDLVKTVAKEGSAATEYVSTKVIKPIKHELNGLAERAELKEKAKKLAQEGSAATEFVETEVIEPIKQNLEGMAERTELKEKTKRAAMKANAWWQKSLAEAKTASSQAGSTFQTFGNKVKKSNFRGIYLTNTDDDRSD